MSVAEIAQRIAAGATFAELFRAGAVPSDVFSALVRLELSEHSSMPVRHRVARVTDEQVDAAFAALGPV